MTEARAEFVRGAELVKGARWSEALAAFEGSAKLRAHSWTTYNIGACLRAMGQYTRARGAFRAALAQNEAAGGRELSETLLGDVRGLLSELDAVLATLTIELSPEEVQIAVDGRPLEPDPSAPETYLAGTLAPGPGQPAPHGPFTVVLDPGAHVLLLSRKGFSDAVHRETLAPGGSTRVRLELSRLPATLHVEANIAQAVVTVAGEDVGLAPVTLQRPAGRYHVVVRRKGYDPYEVDAVLQPGGKVDLSAPLHPERTALTQRWWFWTAAGVVVAGAATGTYFLTRPTPDRPALNGGGLGWTVKAP